MASISKRGKGWSVRWTEYPAGRNGPRRCRSKQVATRRAARQLRAEIERSLHASGTYESSRLGGSQTLGESFAAYLTIEVIPSHRDNTIRSKAQILQVFLEYVRGRSHFVGGDALNALNVARFHAHLLTETGRNGKVRTLNTAAKYVSVIQVAWEWLYTMNTPGISPPRKVKTRRDPPKRYEAPTWEDIDLLIGEQRSVFAQRATILLRFTGLRSSQVCGLDWRDIDLQYGELTIPGHLGKSSQERRGRVVPVSTLLCDEMSTWGVRQGSILPQRRLYAKNWREGWQRVIKKSNRFEGERIRRAVTGQPVHCIRKAFVTELKRRRADTESVEFLVGHTQGIREHYLHSVALPLRDTVELIPPISSRHERTDHDNIQPITQIGEGRRRRSGAPKRNRTQDSD